MKFFAKLQGVDIDAEIKKKEERDKTLFKDPKDYEKLSKEQREELTKQMIGRHKAKLSLGEPDG